MQAKVTNDPAGKANPIIEGTGLVTKDSLAAESIQAGGDFDANNEHRGFSDQPSTSTTSNTTDISAATVLSPAADSEARQAQEEWDEQAILNRGRQEAEPVSNANPTAGSQQSGGGFGGSRGDGDDQGFESSRFEGGPVKPSGKNLKEDPNMSNKGVNYTGNAEPGSKFDSSRAAWQTIEKKNAMSGADAGGGPRQTALEDDDQYKTLDAEVEAP
jgi:hypothetical protein